jgi:ornithine cyclodeaminase/alanine dehydrogenase-like protein (mu-crystallin family)
MTERAMTERAMTAPPYLDVTARVPMPAAIDALEAALAGGLDPEVGPPRSVVEVPAGQILSMPAAAGRYAGVKVVTVAPDNGARDLPRVQGVYLLLDGTTLAPLALLDGIALTALRTPAVSAVAVRHLATPDAARLLVFGTGPQAWGHVAAVRAVRPIGHVDVVGRRPERVAELVDHCRAAGLSAAAASPGDVAGADVVCCCTTARVPLFDSDRLAAHATVVAVGAHEPDAREVDERLVHRATTVVEARSAALREAGDIVLAGRTALATLSELVTGRVTVAPDRPRLFKSVGMAWEDLVVAAVANESR